jgi:hypothetical protein
MFDPDRRRIKKEIWVPHDTRYQVVDFVRLWSDKTEIGSGRFIECLGVAASKLHICFAFYSPVNGILSRYSVLFVRFCSPGVN